MKQAPKKDCQSIVKLSYGMSGKLNNVLSLSTDCTNCKRCIERHNSGNAKCICVHCYAFTILNSFKGKNMLASYRKNADVLTSRVLDYQKEIKPIAREIVSACIKNNTDMFRIESFGDTQNVNHATNYLLLCSAIGELSYIYHVKVGLWTKNFDYYLKAIEALSDNQKDNMKKVTNFVLSNVFIDMPYPKRIIEIVEAKLNMKVKVFNVVSMDNNNITCGARSCEKCGRCYKHSDKTEYITELLK